MTITTSTLFKRLGAATSAVFLVAALSACSPNASDESSAKDSKPAKEMSMEDWRAKLNDCLIDEGVEPPKEEENGMVSFDFSDEAADQMMKATEKCTKKIGEPPVSAGEEMTKEDEERLREIVDCLRKRGHDIPDPKRGALDMSNAELTQEDHQACFAS